MPHVASTWYLPDCFQQSYSRPGMFPERRGKLASTALGNRQHKLLSGGICLRKNQLLI